MIRPFSTMAVALLGLLMVVATWTSRPNSAGNFLREGEFSLSKGDYDSAVAALDQAISLDPRLARAYDSRGKAHQMKHEFDKAIADCTRAVGLQRTDVEAYRDRGHCFESEGEYKAANDDYCQALRVELEAVGIHSEHVVART